MATMADWQYKFGTEGLTFDDVLLIPAASDVMPAEVATVTRLTRSISLNIPILSAAMDTVTEARMAIALAREGGMGVIHRNLSVTDQAREVDKVKRSESGMITDPITLKAEDTLKQAREVMSTYHISGIPITDDSGHLVGILTNRDLRFETNLSKSVTELMTRDHLITVPVGTTLEEAHELLGRYKVEKLPVVDEHNVLRGLITVKDIQKKIQYPHAAKDAGGRLLVGAAVGTGPDHNERVEALIAEECDVIVIDTSHGHSKMVIDTVRQIKRDFGNKAQILAGNVATAEATIALIEAGADGIKAGIGPGSICTTRIVTGAGVPQVTAIFDCARAAAPYDIPVIGDGGVQFSGDIAKALAAGAHTVMLGSLLAGTDESPGDLLIAQGERFKDYRGMGSIGAMKQRSFSKDRYFQGEVSQESQLIAEGIEARVPYKGPLGSIITQLIGGLHQAMGYVGARDIEMLRREARFMRISGAGLRESHPHDVLITKEAPNYGMRR